MTGQSEAFAFECGNAAARSCIMEQHTPHGEPCRPWLISAGMHQRHEMQHMKQFEGKRVLDLATCPSTYCQISIWCLWQLGKVKQEEAEAFSEALSTVISCFDEGLE
eukprot:763826-Hanusia_phi.AAC.2